MERETGSDMTISRLECPVVIEFHEMECVMLAPITATFSPSLSLSLSFCLIPLSYQMTSSLTTQRVVIESIYSRGFPHLRRRREALLGAGCHTDSGLHHLSWKCIGSGNHIGFDR